MRVWRCPDCGQFIGTHQVHSIGYGCNPPWLPREFNFYPTIPTPPPGYESSRTAQLCPVCKGRGEYKKDEGKGVGSVNQCHGCSGKGWVAV